MPEVPTTQEVDDKIAALRAEFTAALEAHGHGDPDPDPDPEPEPEPTPSTTTLTATVLNENQVRVDWTTTRTDVNGWTVGRNGVDDSGSGPWSTTKAPGDRSQTFNDLVAGFEYTFTLIPLTAAGPETPIAKKASTTAPAPTPDPSPNPNPTPGNDTVFPFLPTAARKYGWGTPTHEDEFTANPKNNSAWHVYNGSGHAGNGTRTPNQVFQDPANGGVMSIIGTSGGASAGMAWRVPTGGRKYGRYEVAMKTSAGSQHYHPVLLLWPDPDTNFPAGGEIDFVEIWASADRTKIEHFLHYSSSNHTNTGSPAFNTIDAKQWHAWAVEWTPTTLKAFCDGELMCSWNTPSQYPPGPMHLCLQLDNFSNMGSVAGGGRMDFAWVRQWTI